jgi:hypothetical protein
MKTQQKEETAKTMNLTSYTIRRIQKMYQMEFCATEALQIQVTMNCPVTSLLQITLQLVIFLNLCLLM